MSQPRIKNRKPLVMPDAPAAAQDENLIRVVLTEAEQKLFRFIGSASGCVQAIDLNALLANMKLHATALVAERANMKGDFSVQTNPELTEIQFFKR